MTGSPRAFSSAASTASAAATIRTEAASSALLTDRYELTMLDAALAAGTHERESVFEVFSRRLPHGRRYGVVAGTGRLLELIERFRFGDAELAWLDEQRVVSRAGLDWLASYRFSGTIRGYREGELYFPGSPLLIVEAPFAEGVLLETLILSVLNYDSAVATAASRMVQAAAGRPIAEMGGRRASEQSAVAAARAAYIAGFSATSNLEAGRSWGIPTMGTAAHAFTLLHGSELDAFRAQIATQGVGTTLLVDTYDVTQGVANAVEAAGTNLGGVRLDSGDLPGLARQVRAQLDSLGATGTRITVTNDLDEHAIAALGASPVDSYGVGTSVVTGSGAPASGMVYKLVAHRDAHGSWVNVAKHSDGKATVGGRKRPVRVMDASGRARLEAIYIDAEPDTNPREGESSGSRLDSTVKVGAPADSFSAASADPDFRAVSERELLTSLISDGRIQPNHLGPAGVAAARKHHARVIQELPEVAFRLTPGDPTLDTVFR